MTRLTSMAAALLLATTAHASIIVNVLDQTLHNAGPLTDFGQPTITGDRVDFPAAYQGVTSAYWPGETDTAGIKLGLWPVGLWRVTVAGAGYGILGYNAIYALTMADQQADLVSVGNGRFQQQLTVEVLDVPGDYNHDGWADAADYTVWRNDPDVWGGPVGYGIWRANYGRAMLDVEILTQNGDWLSQPPTIGVDTFYLERVGPESVPSPCASDFVQSVVGLLIGFWLGGRRR